jgi:16S rRNA (cytidine1402-2'-O)-methyltransferase
MKEESRGVLYLIPSGIGEQNISKFRVQSSKLVVEENHLSTINHQLSTNKEIINSLDEFIVENERTARRELKASGYNKPINEIKFHILNEHTKAEEYALYLDSAKQGRSIGLLSESGCPCIADPGKEIVRAAHELNIRVVPLTGPSSIILGLMASGFNGQNFAFIGYLPVDKEERVKALKQLEADIYRNDLTQIFIEAPYRNMQLFEAIIKTCSEQSRLCIATDLTMPSESIRSMSIKSWKKLKPDINKRNTIFLLYK